MKRKSKTVKRPSRKPRTRKLPRPRKPVQPVTPPEPETANLPAVRTREMARIDPMKFSADEIALVKRTVAIGATNDELAMFLHQCRRTQLDPLARQIYFVKRSGKATIQTGIDGYRLVAHRSGKYAGNDNPVYEGEVNFGQGNEEGVAPLKATVTVWRMVAGQRIGFGATAHWQEYYPGEGGVGFMWRKMPCLMLGKVAEALALRKAFPAELSGVYAEEEMDQAGPDDKLAAPALAGGNSSNDIPPDGTEKQPVPADARRTWQALFDQVDKRLREEPRSVHKSGYTPRLKWEDAANLWPEFGEANPPFETAAAALEAFAELPVDSRRALYAKIRLKWLRSDKALMDLKYGRTDAPDDFRPDDAALSVPAKPATRKAQMPPIMLSTFWTKVRRLLGCTQGQAEVAINQVIRLRVDRKQTKAALIDWLDLDALEGQQTVAALGQEIEAGTFAHITGGKK